MSVFIQNLPPGGSWLPTSLITKTRFVGPDWRVAGSTRELSENKTCLNYAGKNLVLDNQVMMATKTTQLLIKLIPTHHVVRCL